MVLLPCRYMHVCVCVSVRICWLYWIQSLFKKKQWTIHTHTHTHMTKWRSPITTTNILHNTIGLIQFWIRPICQSMQPTHPPPQVKLSYFYIWYYKTNTIYIYIVCSSNIHPITFQIAVFKIETTNESCFILNTIKQHFIILKYILKQNYRLKYDGMSHFLYLIDLL